MSVQDMYNTRVCSLFPILPSFDTKKEMENLHIETNETLQE